MLDHAEEGLSVLDRQLALADVERAAFGTEREKPIESDPIIDRPGVAAAWDREGRRRRRLRPAFAVPPSGSQWE